MVKKQYYVCPIGKGYGETCDPGPLFTLAEARKALTKAVRVDAKNARRIFGTAVVHRHDDRTVKITATRDKNSALWGYLTIRQWSM